VILTNAQHALRSTPRLDEKSQVEDLLLNW
jgi:hypothetical protein